MFSKVGKYIWGTGIYVKVLHTLHQRSLCAIKVDNSPTHYKEASMYVVTLSETCKLALTLYRGHHKLYYFMALSTDIHSNETEGASQ